MKDWEWKPLITTCSYCNETIVGRAINSAYGGYGHVECIPPEEMVWQSERDDYLLRTTRRRLARLVCAMDRVLAWHADAKKEFAKDPHGTIDEYSRRRKWLYDEASKCSSRLMW